MFGKLLGKLQSNRHFREILLGSGLALSVKVIAAGLTFFMNILIARKLGPTEAGLFFLGLTLVTVLAAIGRFGLDNSIIRYIAIYQVSGDWSGVYSIYRKGVVWAGLFCLSIMITLLLTSKLLVAYVFPQAGFVSVLNVMLFSLPLVGLYTLHSSALQGVKKVARASATLLLMVPMVSTIGLLVFPINTAKQLGEMHVFACSLALLFGYSWWRGSSIKTEYKQFPSKKLLDSCIPLWGVMILTQILNWSSQIMLGIWGSSENVALFAVAQRTAMLTSFVLIAVNVIAAPKFAAMYSQGDMDGLRKVSQMSVRLLLLAATPALAFIVVFSEWLMSLFGPDFIAASASLVILSIGQFINIATGSVGLLLSMTGHERHLRFNVLVGATIGITLGIALIPIYGLIGGSIATAFAVASQNLLGVRQVKRLFGFNTMAIWQRL